MLSNADRRRRDRRITRGALRIPSMSAFAYLFQSGCDQSLITSTGFDHRSFRHLLPTFTDLHNRYSPYSEDGYIRLMPMRRTTPGRPRSMSSLHCLGLVLAWTRTRGSEMVLCSMFGVTASVCSLFLRFGRRLQVYMLSRDPKAAVKMPTTQEIEEYKAAISTKYSLLEEVYAVADRVKIYLEHSGDSIIQNMFYNGWQHDHYVSNVLVFAPSGIIIACALNAPGSMHDSAIAESGKVYEKLEDAFNRTGGLCVVDSAFCKAHYPFLVKSAQDYMVVTGNAADVLKIRQATSARQASKWGMMVFQGSFPRMKDRQIYEERGERKLILTTVV